MGRELACPPIGIGSAATRPNSVLRDGRGYSRKEPFVRVRPWRPAAADPLWAEVPHFGPFEPDAMLICQRGRTENPVAFGRRSLREVQVRILPLANVRN